MMKHLFPCLFCILIFAGFITAQPQRDGKIFDQGFTMTRESASAPEQLQDLRYLYGQWDVAVRTATSDSTDHLANGLARISYLNRGHGFLEKLYCENFNGADDTLHTISFLAFNQPNRQWSYGIANSYTENITTYNGPATGKNLVLSTAIRRIGSVLLHHYRLRYERQSDEAFTVSLETSTDGGEIWRTLQKKSYRKRPPVDGFMSGENGFGRRATTLPPEAHQFDFLIGEWTSQHEIVLGNGRVAKFPSNSSAVYALNGHAILEHDWYNVDPGLPEAATNIVRIYNRAMRRWECMFLTNRFNTVLYFGGHREDDQIILTLFETDTSQPGFSYFIFHDIGENAYLWHSEVSNDHGNTFQHNWKISAVRKTN